MIFMDGSRNAWIWIVALLALLFVLGSFGMGGYGMMGFGGGWIVMLLFWGVLIWLVVMLVGAAQSGKKDDDPSTILKRRYASGEISKKQYEELKKELKVRQ